MYLMIITIQKQTLGRVTAIMKENTNDYRWKSHHCITQKQYSGFCDTRYKALGFETFVADGLTGE